MLCRVYVSRPELPVAMASHHTQSFGPRMVDALLTMLTNQPYGLTMCWRCAVHGSFAPTPTATARNTSRRLATTA